MHDTTKNLLFLLATTISAGCVGDDGSADEADDDSGGDDAGACGGYAMKSAECFGADYYAAVLDDCQGNLANAVGVSSECGAAYEALLVCVSALACDEFVSQEPCADAQAAVGMACG